ncbi:MAG TPA: hypothetical protein PKA27_02765 [Fimbriimonadaceae bacterium]|nr:hypothetical protein [Fimbriimonadaceae bacterium]
MKIPCGFYAWLEGQSHRRVFGRLASVVSDRHTISCSDCSSDREELSLALDMLRGSSMDFEPSPQFDERLLRRVQVDRVRHSLNYWSPAFVGAAVAALVILTAIQIVSGPAEMPSIKFGNGRAPEARNTLSSEASYLPTLAPRMLDQ